MHKYSQAYIHTETYKRTYIQNIQAHIPTYRHTERHRGIQTDRETVIQTHANIHK